MTAARPPRPGLLGPVFAYDLVRQSRRGRVWVVRGVYALGLLVALFVVFQRHFGGPGVRRAVAVGELARFAGEVHVAFLWAQFAAVVLLTPAFAAGALTDEKERRTLEHLLVTDLRDREIVVGKLASRLLHLGGVLLAGLPVLAALQLWGGVDPRDILAGFGFCTVTALNLGVLGVWMSVLCRTTVAAVGWTYALTALAGAFCACLGLPAWSQSGNVYDLAFAYGMLSLCASSFCLVLAVLEVRASHLSLADRHHSLGKEPSAELLAAAAALKPSPTKLVPLPPVGDRPLFWKEYHLGRSRPTEDGRVTVDILWAFGAIAIITIVIATSIRLADSARPGGPRPAEEIEFIASLGGGLSAAFAVGLLVGVSIRVAGSVTRERERRTLDCLMTLPIDWRDLLAAKAFGAVARRRRTLLALAVLWLFGLVGGATDPRTGLLLPVALGCQLALAASYALLLSVICRTTLGAQGLLAATLVLVVGGPYTEEGVDALLNWVGVGAVPWPPVFGHPWGVWAFLTTGRPPTDRGTAPAFEATLAWTLAGMAAQALAAWVIWRGVSRQFRPEPPGGD